jgi:hypothetical protein
MTLICSGLFCFESKLKGYAHFKSMHVCAFICYIEVCQVWLEVNHVFFLFSHTCTYMYIHVHTCTYMYIHVHTCTYMYIHVHTCTYFYPYLSHSGCHKQKFVDYSANLLMWNWIATVTIKMCWIRKMFNISTKSAVLRSRHQKGRLVPT